MALHLLTPTAVRAVIYARISDDRTGLAAGVDRQEQDARSLCERRGWDVVSVEVDNDLSASRYSTKPRPAYLRVLAMAERGDVDVIACYDVDRLYRQPKELEHLIDLAEKVTIASVQGDLRLDSSDGRAIARVLAAMAAKSSDDTSRRIKRKHLETAKQGLPSIGRRRPFGYERDALSVRESEAVRVREAAARILGGDSLGAICRDWAAAGVTTPDGNRWQTSALRRMLEAPRLAGLRAINGQVIGEAAWPPLLDRSTWEAVKATLAGRVIAGGANSGARSYLLSGLIFCGECGGPMGSAPLSARGRRYRRYYCRTARGGCGKVGVNADGAEGVVGDLIVADVSKSGPLDQPTRIDLSSQLSVQLLALEHRLTNLAGMGMDDRAYFARAKVITAEMDAIRRQMADQVQASIVDELAGSRDPAAKWAAMSFDRRRAVVLGRIERVDVTIWDGSAGFDEGRVQVTRR